MGQLDRGLGANNSPNPMDDEDYDDEQCRFLGSLTPEFVRNHVLATDRLEVIAMIQRHVPGYGPH